MDPEKLTALTLQKLRLNVVHRIPFQELIAASDATAVIDKFTGDLVATLSAEVMCEKLSRETRIVHFSAPATWWQFFKAQYFPPWLLRKFPVQLQHQNTEVVMERVAIFPKMSLLQNGIDYVRFNRIYLTGLKPDAMN